MFNGIIDLLYKDLFLYMDEYPALEEEQTFILPSFVEKFARERVGSMDPSEEIDKMCSEVNSKIKTENLTVYRKMNTVDDYSIMVRLGYKIKV